MPRQLRGIHNHSQKCSRPHTWSTCREALRGHLAPRWLPAPPLSAGCAAEFERLWHIISMHSAPTLA